jgi:hypothetical protein
MPPAHNANAALSATGSAEKKGAGAVTKLLLLIFALAAAAGGLWASGIIKR